MRARDRKLTLAIAIVLFTSGCAVGNFITGAPSAHGSAPTHALLARRCGGCHMVPDPGTMSATGWQAALERMKLRMRLPASEWDSLAAMPTR